MTILEQAKDSPWAAFRNAVIGLAVGLASYYLTVGVRTITGQMESLKTTQAKIQSDVEWIRARNRRLVPPETIRIAIEKTKENADDIQTLERRMDKLEQKVY